MVVAFRKVFGCRILILFICLLYIPVFVQWMLTRRWGEYWWITNNVNNGCICFLQTYITLSKIWEKTFGILSINWAMKLNTMLYFTCILLITCDMNLPNIMMKETIICQLNSSHTLSKGTNWVYTSQDVSLRTISHFWCWKKKPQ